MIAILGATGFIGASLARRIAGSGTPLHLFARDPARLAAMGWGAGVVPRALEGFEAAEFDLVINALGAGDPARVAAMGSAILDLTDDWDRRVIRGMGPRTAYVFLSSGAVYGPLTGPATEGTEIALPVNRLGEVPPYTMAKLHAEARHRYERDRPILDLRVFAYADPGIALDGRFFLSELARAVATRTPFVTSAADMVRDYAGAEELSALIGAWRAAGAPNAALDLHTRAPAGKWEILAAARARFGLEVRTVEDAGWSPTGAKPLYASAHHAAAAYGYVPRRTALDVVLDTLAAHAPSPGQGAPPRLPSRGRVA